MAWTLMRSLQMSLGYNWTEMDAGRKWESSEPSEEYERCIVAFLVTKTRAQRFPKMEVVGVSLPFPKAVACEMRTWPWFELFFPFALTGCFIEFILLF